ncbi:MAG: cytochrome c oxidase subunit I [Chloroflexi bacterium]|nr:cytochrome c oxidase subunit I [Chloroflexota bacterium]
MRRIFSLGLIRGLITTPVGVGIGMGLTMLVRLLMGLPAWESAPVSFIGAIVGVVAFLVGVGAFTDWWGWARGQQARAPSHPSPDVPTWTRYFNFDPGHKIIGIQYAVTAILILFLAGLMALLIRLELLQPAMQFLTLDSYNHITGIHGIVMIASILVGIAGMANYLVPLLIGAEDMVFPRLNALSFWLIPPAATLVLLSLFTGGFDTGWTGYPPLGVRAPLGAQFFYSGVFVLGLSSILGSINFILTILKLRAPGMSLFRMPILAWTLLATSIIQLIATQFIATAFMMVVAERLIGIGFFDPARGGSAILFQHIFWFYSHPVVYVFVLPGFGVISELLPVFARKPLFGYRWVALSSITIAFVGFLVWAHHMFTVGIGVTLQIVFMFSTLLVAVPTGIKMFSWLATVWGGKLSFETPMLFVIGALIVFLMGGLTGPFLALVPTDIFLHETYWVVSHFHQTMFGGYIFPFLAATYFWFPKVTGFKYNEKLGKLHFWLLLAGFLTLTAALYRVGLMGMLRRVADYEPNLGYEIWNLIATVGGFAIGASMLIFAINLLWSLRARVPAPDNPWRSRSPEWQISSPPPEENFPSPLVVTGSPYDYGVPGSVYVHVGEPASE